MIFIKRKIKDIRVDTHKIIERKTLYYHCKFSITIITDNYIMIEDLYIL